MGILEKRSQKRHIQEIILKTVAVAGIVGVGLVAPGVFAAMKRMKLLPYAKEKVLIERSREKLVQRGMLELKNGQLRITSKGRFYLLKNTFTNQEKPKKKWDGKWRVLIFDIPENLRFIRDAIRSTLISIGFIRLQNSVWIYPYDCEDLVILLKADLEISKNLLYMIVDTLEDDEPIKTHFKLK